MDSKKNNEYQRTQVSEDASTIHGDALTHVLGKEHNGRVRGAGSGVTPTLLNLEALSKSHTVQIKMELKDLKKLFEELKAAFIKNTNKQADRIDIDSMMKNSRDIQLDHNETSHKRKCSEDTSHAKVSDDFYDFYKCYASFIVDPQTLFNTKMNRFFSCC
ncbi:hypothetical protein WN943_023186 [Citrus x changshan-huyou]